MREGEALKRPDKLPQLDLFRFFAICGVISVHSSSTAAAVDGIHSKYFPIFNTMNIFFKFGTPCFIFLSSFVLFYNYYNRPDTGSLIARFYRKRTLYIIIPYLLISIAYLFFNKGMNGWNWLSWDEEWARFVKKLSTGSMHTHLYFVFINMQFYLLFPLFLILLKKVKGAALWAFPVGLALQWTYVLLNHEYHFKWYIPKGSLSITYLSYYMLGAFTAIYFDKLRGWLTSSWKQMKTIHRVSTVVLSLSWLAVAILHVMIWYMSRLHHTRFNTLLFELLWNVHTLLSAYFLLFVAFQLYRLFADNKLIKLLAVIGQLSFAIYLIHPMVLAIYRKYGGSISPFVSEYVMWIWGGFAAALLLSFLVSHLLFRYVPGIWVLLGSKPAYLGQRGSSAAKGTVGRHNENVKA
ncbi:acyltransferase [Paenibacillus xylaniclasticus]|uniref:acyltransferase n=1 Tax=Paenibacillus xylaniclasticus TaxID=588083 RepID=UPI000FDADA24|nr:MULTISPECIES: acyltransferase [Paenibacillus]GFN30496.1 acyltransferase 3 [Paenibacillus curdlanolyticus]